MSVFIKIWYFFTPYVDARERQVAAFFRRVNESSSHQKIQKKVYDLLQKNGAVLNLWTEYRYRGYVYLGKRKRRELYKNLAAIEQKFDAFLEQKKSVSDSDPSNIFSYIPEALGIYDKSKTELFSYMAALMEFLAPKNNLYEYRESSSFGRMLQDPDKGKLVGDCNQIVTLYVHLFSRKFELSDLELTILPGHIALRLGGVDIEATQGVFTLYAKKGQRQAPISELVSVNLLDVTDEHFKKSTIAADVFLQAARLAYIVSGHRELVRNNLAASYQNAVGYLIQQGNFKRAMQYAKQSSSQELIEHTAIAGANDALRRHDFSHAHWFAKHSLKKREMGERISRNEAVFLYTASKFLEAALLFERNADHSSAKKCYRALFAQEQKKITHIKTIEELKKYTATVQKMQQWAQKSGDEALISHTKSIIKQLQKR